MAAEMTFEQFQATGKVCEDLGAALSDSSFDEYGKARGRLYLDVLWIQERPASGWLNGADGRWFLILANADWLTDDLEGLERKLYQFAIDEDYIADPSHRREMIELVSDLISTVGAICELDERKGDGARLFEKYPQYLPSADEFCSDLVAWRDSLRGDE